MAAAGFQPALEDSEAARLTRESRLKGGCGQNCPPHIWGRMLYGKNFAALPFQGGILPEFPNPFQQGPACSIELRGEYETSYLVPATPA